MAIYSCNLASVGRTTHAAGTAGAHLGYIAREDAKPVLDAHVIPRDPVQARTWMDRQEAADRKNARVLDKVRIALPRELSKEERLALAREFCGGLTGGRVPWMFAIHQEGKDAHNPHAHIVIRDRDIETGKRVLRLSDSARDREQAGLEPKAVDWIRQRWEHHANEALARAGHDARIDRRTLEAQGIERDPTIHIGPRAQHIDGYVQRPTSKARTGGRGRTIDYPVIDQGRTRKERQAEIIDLNLERDARSADIETRARAQFERAQRQLDARLEAQLTEQVRRRTAEERKVRAFFRGQQDELRLQRRDEYQAVLAKQREALAPRVAALRSRQGQERDSLRQRQGQFWNRVVAVIDFTGSTRRRQEEVRKALSAAHKDERLILADDARRSWTALKAAMEGRYGPREERRASDEARAMAALKEMHGRAEAMADAKRQLRETEREQERQRLDRAVAAAKALETRTQQPEPPARRVASSLDAQRGQARQSFTQAAAAPQVQPDPDAERARRLAEIKQRLADNRARDRGRDFER